MYLSLTTAGVGGQPLLAGETSRLQTGHLKEFFRGRSKATGVPRGKFIAKHVACHQTAQVQTRGLPLVVGGIWGTISISLNLKFFICDVTMMSPLGRWRVVSKRRKHLSAAPEVRVGLQLLELVLGLVLPFRSR